MTSPAKVTWFEITSNDPTASRSFYESLFGWTAQGDPDVYLNPGGVRSAYVRDLDGSIFSVYRVAQPPTTNE